MGAREGACLHALGLCKARRGEAALGLLRGRTAAEGEHGLSLCEEEVNAAAGSLIAHAVVGLAAILDEGERELVVGVAGALSSGLGSLCRGGRTQGR
jgi:hypothetical protein